MGLLSLQYRRPDYVDKPINRRGSDDDSSNSSMLDGKSKDGSVRSGQSGRSGGIPSALSFDRIVDGGTCPPMTVRDFMNYLIYIERSAENLQFFLWYRDYVKRFNEATTSDISLAPEWTKTMEDDTLARLQKEHMERLRKVPAAAQMFNGTDFDEKAGIEAGGTPDAKETKDPFSTPPSTPGYQESTHSQPTNQRVLARDAFIAAGVKPPFTIQPFREELDRVIATYIMDHSPRQLNLSSREQKALMSALAYTTHPSAFRAVARSVEQSLRQQAHPNFIRWSVCNGNPPRVFFARALGASLILIGTAAAVLLTLSKVGRGWRALAAIGWVMGISTLVAAWKGMCVVLHGLHHRHIRPWELFENEDGLAGENCCCAAPAAKASFESFGSANSYEEEPWIVKYQKRNVVRKIFDREVWIQEPALRQIQDTIFVQAILLGLVVGGIATAVFVVLPGGNYF